MGIEAWLTLLTILVCFGVLFATSISADAVLITGAVFLMVLGVLTPAEFLSGFANQGMATVGVLFIVAGALTRTGALFALTDLLLGKTSSTARAQIRLMTPVAVMSSVLNNTPVVAMMIPIVNEWAKRFEIHPSKLMMPLSYAAIVGGVCTLVGTSTNLVVNEMYKGAGYDGIGLFELAIVGVPLTFVTIVFVVVASRWLLPARGSSRVLFDDTKQYTIEMLVVEQSPLVGKSIEEAGLRRLSGVFLAEVIRAEKVIVAVSSSEKLVAGDRLVFAGNVESVVDLQKIRGLQLADDQVFKIEGDRSQRKFYEVVLGNSFPHLGRTVRECEFRKKYSAAILAISREGEQLKQRMGDIVLRRGDILLLETLPEFNESRRYSADFLLISEISNSAPTLHGRRYFALLILFSMLGAVAFNWLSMFESACVAVIALLVMRCISLQEARTSIDWQILVVIAASIALGVAVESSGLAQTISQTMLSLVGGSPYVSLILVFSVTAVLTALVSNVAAAVIVFPIAQAAATSLSVSIEPFVVVLMIAASASFATPLGYQTNLMVYGPGNYRYRDFLLMGGPLTMVVGLVTLILTPLVWPF